jgi:hypothetical protein
MPWCFAAAIPPSLHYLIERLTWVRAHLRGHSKPFIGPGWCGEAYRDRGTQLIPLSTRKLNGTPCRAGSSTFVTAPPRPLRHRHTLRLAVPQNVIDIARKWLGDDNVLLFPK